MIANIKDGGLKLPDITSFHNAQKAFLIKRLQISEGNWKNSNSKFYTRLSTVGIIFLSGILLILLFAITVICVQIPLNITSTTVLYHKTSG